MRFEPGTKLGHYEISAPIGVGGMGEVYRATDTKLKRDVALKVLPEAFARDSERMARFQREAEVLASLNHPNIAQIYGIEDRALVMEMVEGESPKGPMPFEEAWRIALQITDALEYAHEKGVIHRDLKPANVKVTPEGVVKLLDFGLAKAFGGDGSRTSAEDAANSPTLTLGATVAGVILGTAAYMAPEQAKGKQVDKRADIWSWGVVLYELLTGERLFAGDDVADTLAQVLTKQPDLNEIPVEARQLLKKCLEKDPKKRLRDIGDARELLLYERAIPQRVVDVPPRSRLGLVASAIAAVFALSLASLAFVHFREALPERRVVRFQIPAPEGTRLTPPAVPALSPDGRYLAFVATGTDGVRRIWLHGLESIESRPLPGTEGANPPGAFWSPDSRTIGFATGSQLKRVDIQGGPAIKIVDGVPFGGGTWNRDGVILVGSPQGVYRISLVGGQPELVTHAQTVAHAFPHFLPDGTRFVYHLGGSGGTDQSSLDHKESRQLLAPPTSRAEYAPPTESEAPGYLLYVRDSTLIAQPIEPASLAARGEAFVVANSIGTAYDGALAFFSVSDNGELAYVTASDVGDRQLTWFDLEGRPQGTVGPVGGYDAVSISHDGKRIASSNSASYGSANIQVMELAQGAFSRFTFEEGHDTQPLWSPDDKRLIFSSDRQNSYGNFVPYWKDSSGAGTDEPLLKPGPAVQVARDWSLDGKLVIYDGARNGREIWTIPITVGQKIGEAKPTLYLKQPFPIFQPQFSPELGTPHWVAYVGNPQGRPEVYVESFPPGSGKYLISNAGGSQPRWRRDGKELFYISPAGSVMAVDITLAPQFEHSQPRELFKSNIVGGNGTFHYAITPDGKKLLIATATYSTSQNSPSPPITVVLNWLAGLKKQ
jgi:Tol biopolymer transport system component